MLSKLLLFVANLFLGVSWWFHDRAGEFLKMYQKRKRNDEKR